MCALGRGGRARGRRRGRPHVDDGGLRGLQGAAAEDRLDVLLLARELPAPAGGAPRGSRGGRGQNAVGDAARG